jgi:hypothetical protein
MVILPIVLGAFALIEVLNVILLYKLPGSTMGNAVGVFRAYEKTRDDPEIRAFVDYLINWVAGTKLIFIALIIGIILTGPPETQVFSAGALILTISSFYFGLYPVLRSMDSRNELQPHGYSRTLARMIGGFILVFAVALIAHLILPAVQ